MICREMNRKLALMTMGLLSLSLLGLFSTSTRNMEMLESEHARRKSSQLESDSESENFTIVVLPDTQFYSAKYPWIFENQTLWIIQNVESMNILFVSHVGDLVQNWDRIDEWEHANASISILDGFVPWAVLPGNHDGFYGGLENYNKYFGYERFVEESWYGDAYLNNNTNSFQLFQSGRDDYLMFHLQYDPSENVLSWADDIISRYPRAKVIITTHDYLHSSSDSHRSEIGEKISQKLIHTHSTQIFLVLCGHNFWYNDEKNTHETVNGNMVYELLANYQGRVNGGNGWLRILEFSPNIGRIFVKTYSPYLNKFETDPDSQFVLDYSISDSNDIVSHHQLPSALELIILIVFTITTLVLVALIAGRCKKVKMYTGKESTLIHLTTRWFWSQI